MEHGEEPPFHAARLGDQKKLHEKRQRRGECPKCGIKLYKIGVLGKKKTPLTIKGHVDAGRCLGCHPYLPKEQQEHLNPVPKLSNSQDQSVPRFLSLEEKSGGGSGEIDDAGTVISGITLDQQLRLTDDDEDEGNHHGHGRTTQDNASPTTSSGRKTVSDANKSTNEEGAPAAPLDRAVTAAFDNRTSAKPTTATTEASARVSKYPHAPNSPQEQIYPSPEAISADIPFSPLAPPKGTVTKRPERREIFFDSSATWVDKDTTAAKEDRKSETQQHEIVVMPESLPTTQPKETLELSISTSMRMAPGIASDSGGKVGGYNAEYLSKLLASSSSSEAPELATMQSITDQLWFGGKKAKLLFQKSRGYEFLSQAMWSHMVHEPLEEKAVEMFLSTVAFEKEQDGKDKDDNFETTAMLATEAARNAMEALLFVMQSLSHNENIQITACRALVCLATASGLTEGQVDDGSSSGAAAVVLLSMSAHRNSVSVLKWCMRALYELCTISFHAESNKRTVLAATTLDDGGSGLTVVLHCLQDSVAEAVRLVWCLSASENAQGALDPTGSVLQTIVDILRKNVKSSSTPLLEALLGAISNLYVMTNENLATSDPNELVLLAFQAAKDKKESVSLCTEAVALIANIAASTPMDKNLFANRGGVELIAQLIMDHDDATLHEESTCALLSLAIGCDRVKAVLRSQVVFAAIKRLCRVYESSVRLQEILFTLISTMLVTTDANAESCEKDSIGLICFAMTLHSSSEGERVQESCCIGLRNLSSRDKNIQEHLSSSDAVDLVIDAMSRHPESKIIVTNGCATLCNVGFRVAECLAESKTVINILLKAMRAHLDDIELVSSCLSLFLGMFVESAANKKVFSDENGVEVATSVMLIHRENEPILIYATGVLTSLTLIPEVVPAILDAGAVSCTVDTIRGQSPSTDYLHSALQFLTNVVLAKPDQCQVVGGIMPVLMERMQRNPDAVEFQSEACRLLWALASLSASVRARIVDLGGVAVLLATLEHNKEGDVQNNALEAFNEIAANSTPTGQVAS